LLTFWRLAKSKASGGTQPAGFESASVTKQNQDQHPWVSQTTAKPLQARVSESGNIDATKIKPLQGITIQTAAEQIK
jgi:hypothetical protein